MGKLYSLARDKHSGSSKFH